MDKVLVRDGRHMRPILAVLERYDLGAIDSYGRGRWLYVKDLPLVREAMLSDPNVRHYAGLSDERDAYVYGTNIHNVVWFHDIKELFD